MQHTAERTAVLPQWRPTANDRPLTGLTVLVVEDSRFASEAVRLLCLRSGARIRRADCLQAAGRHLQTYRPGVVLVDMGLPDGDGSMLIRQISGKGPGAPVVLGISGNPDMRDAALVAGAAGFLTKPIENLAVFQQAILCALPAEVRVAGLRPLPNETVMPDPAALRQDLAHVAQVLAQATDTGAIDYIVKFLAGVARSAKDEPLSAAAQSLAHSHHSGHAMAMDLARISGLVHDRLQKLAS